MKYGFHKWFWFCSFIFLVNMLGCSQIDDYFLGKDNTPQPKPLPNFSDKVALRAIWSEKLGQAPIVHDKLMPAVQGERIFVALPDGKIQARSLKTGALIWSHVIPAGFISGPVIGSGRLALGTRHSSLVLLSQTNGQLLWEKKLSGEALAAPTISGGRVYTKTVDGNVYAHDLTTGKRIWRVQHGAPDLILKASSSPFVGGSDWMVVGFSDGKLSAIQPATGRLLWEKALIYAQGASEVERLVDIDADPILFGHSVIVGIYQGFVGAMSLENGEFVWQKPISVYKNMALKQRRLYVTDDKDVVWSIDPTQGQVDWKQIKLKIRGLTTPVILPQGILVGDKLGYLHVLSKKDGALIGRLKLGDGIVALNAVGERQVVALTNTGSLHLVTVSSGEKR